MNASRTPAFLMANLGIEVERLHIAHEAKDEIGFVSAQSRAGRIISQLRLHPDMEARMEEINGLEHIISAIGKNDALSIIPRSQFQEYFSPFSTRTLTS